MEQGVGRNTRENIAGTIARSFYGSHEDAAENGGHDSHGSHEVLDI